MVFSLELLNRRPKQERECYYLQLIPPLIYEKFKVDPNTLMNPFGEKVVQGIFPSDENFACVEVRHRTGDKDCLFSLQLSLDSFMRSVHIDFLIINDPFSERFNVDTDQSGKDTFFGFGSRNIPEEIRAMEAGLAPGMVRHGLKLLGESLKSLEAFTIHMGLKAITLGALYYHNAILWERYGFQYLKGGRIMEKIDQEFQSGGALWEKLDGSTPFRRRGMEKTVRGRSWAIYDGLYIDVFEDEWESPTMYKMIHSDLKVNTFPDQIY